MFRSRGNLPDNFHHYEKKYIKKKYLKKTSIIFSLFTRFILADLLVLQLDIFVHGMYDHIYCTVGAIEQYSYSSYQRYQQEKFIKHLPEKASNRSKAHPE
jgi:hypothetical protein